jgi:serine/threonine-protein kinase ATR
VTCTFIGPSSSSQFRKSFNGYGAQRRVSIAKALSELACPLAHGESSECSRPMGKGLSLLSTYIMAIQLVLQGRAHEVTPAVRKSGNQVLCLAVRHHSIELGLKEVDDVAIELYQSLVHKDRAVRLSAGSVFNIRLCLPSTYHVFGHPSQVLVEIISFYNRVGQVSWVRAEGIFDKFYELLRDARDPVKETVLITIGRVGRLGICPDDFNCTHRFLCSSFFRVTTTNFLGVAISCLISQLADPNPALKGIAYMQVCANQRSSLQRCLLITRASIVIVTDIISWKDTLQATRPLHRGHCSLSYCSLASPASVAFGNLSLYFTRTVRVHIRNSVSHTPFAVCQL